MSLPPDQTLPTRYSLLSRLQDWGDQDSWRDFFETYWRLIYSVALKSGLTESEAQDVVQETVICVAKDIQKFKRQRDLGSFKAWLRQITRWRIADQFSRRSPDAFPVHGAEEPPTASGAQPLEHRLDSSSSALEKLWEEEWHKSIFAAALAKVKTSVKEEYFQIFDLYVLKEWPAKKVSTTLGVSLGTIYLAKHRVSSLLKKHLQALEKNI